MRLSQKLIWKFKTNLVMGGVGDWGQSILFSVGDIVGIPKYTFIPFNI